MSREVLVLLELLLGPVRCTHNPVAPMHPRGEQPGISKCGQSPLRHSTGRSAGCLGLLGAHSSPELQE